MAIEPNAETWLRVSTKITLANAQMNDLLLRIRAASWSRPRNSTPWSTPSRIGCATSS